MGTSSRHERDALGFIQSKLAKVACTNSLRNFYVTEKNKCTEERWKRKYHSRGSIGC